MKKWDEIWKLWNKYNVPDIKVRNFLIGEYSSHSPWFSLNSNSQYIFVENPLKQTAYHLAIYLKDKSPELLAAYKLYAFLKCYYSTHILQTQISEVMEKNDEVLYGWWNANARYVIPPIDKHISYIDISPRNVTDKDYKILIKEAAEVWTQISLEWEIIIIPDYMDRDSLEYEEFQKFSEKLYEDREYQNYLRLKEKFGE